MEQCDFTLKFAPNFPPPVHHGQRPMPSAPTYRYAEFRIGNLPPGLRRTPP